MEEQTKNPLPLFTKISLGANILLFGITGIIYLINADKYNLVGYLLLAAGLTNVIWMLFSIPTRNLLFAILNFIFSGVSIFVALNLQFKESANNYFAAIWFAIALFYLINGFVIMLKLKKKHNRED